MSARNWFASAILGGLLLAGMQHTAKSTPGGGVAESMAAAPAAGSYTPASWASAFLGVIREPTEQQLLAGNRASLSTSTLMDDTRFACERATFTAMLDKLLDETTPL